MKQFVALARVSSREQEREGFSLEVQEEALKRYARLHDGEIIQLFKIAETASKRDERKTFKEMIAFAKKRAAELDGLLFYKVDRAARNLVDYVELERLESEYDVPFISVSQPTENNPAGRMMRRTLANMASFFTEQMAVDISQGINRRVQEGLFPGKAPYGYRNVRKNGRSLVEVDPVAAENVRRIFHLYAYENCTLEGVVARLAAEGRSYRPERPQFSRTSIHNMLTDRAYIGEIQYRGGWHPGKQEPLIDRGTWNRVQALLGGGNQQSHTLTYAAEFMACGHCGRPITGELKYKKTKGGLREYVYYRCTQYNQPRHPRTRVTEAELDRQVLAIFDRLRIEDEAVRDWFRAVLISQTRDQEADSRAQRAELQRQASLLVAQQDRLLNLRLDDQIDEAAFMRKQTELRDRLASIKLQQDAVDRSRDEMAELAVKVFELSQTLRSQWVTADYAMKRRILEIVFLNCRLEDATLCRVIRKPFDVLVKGLLVPQSGGRGIENRSRERRMLSIKPIAKAAVGATVRYFTDYVVSGGEPGVWHGEGAEALGLAGKEVRAEQLENLLRGSSPSGDMPLVQHQSARRLHRPGHDFCFSAPKSVSTLLAVADFETCLAVREAHRNAVSAALGYLQDEAAVARSGKGGLTKERGGPIVAAFEHLTSRPVGDAPPDPQLHTHCIVANVVTRAGGRTGTLVSPILYRHKMAAGALYRAELAYQLERRLGLVLERDGSSFKLAGLPGELVKEWSKRREGIEAELLRTGRSGAIASARATVETRAEKKHLPVDDLFADWQRTARRFGFGPEQVKDLLMRQPPRQDVAERVSAAIRTAIERVTREHSHFSERELLRFAAEEGQARGLPAFLLRHAVRQELARGPEIIALGRHRGELRYTTREMMAMEAELLRTADAMNGAALRPLSGKSVERAVKKHELSGEKREALHHLARGTGIAVVSGMAGTGKTTLLRAFNKACVAEGHTVFGMAVSGKAARELEERAGIKSVTVARFLYDQGKDVTDTLKHHARMLGRAALGRSTWKEERIRLGPKTVLVCDESSMLGTRAMRDILAAARAAGAKVVLVGDDRQMQPIESGAPFRAIAERVGEARLTEITRQKDPRDRENVRRIAAGRAREALEDYAERGLLHVAADRRQAAEQLIAEWKTRGIARPEENLILAATNREVGVLNRMAQEERRRSGELGGFRASVASKQLFLGTPAIRLGEDWLYEGDRCLFTKNARSLGVNNGHLATVLRLDRIKNTLTARLDGGRVVTVPLGYYGAENVRLGYAVTSFKAQGATVVNAYVLFGGALQHRELSYVQASRASGETRLFTDRLDAGEDLSELSRQAAQSRVKTLAHEVLERNRGRGQSPGW